MNLFYNKEARTVTIANPMGHVFIKDMNVEELYKFFNTLDNFFFGDEYFTEDELLAMPISEGEIVCE